MCVCHCSESSLHLCSGFVNHGHTGHMMQIHLLLIGLNLLQREERRRRRSEIMEVFHRDEGEEEEIRLKTKIER